MNLFAVTRQFLRQSVLARVGLTAAVLLLLAALLAPWIAPADPAAQNLPARLQGPSRVHWMGTDELGRDTLSRTLYGARVSLLVAVSVVLGCGATGLLVGMLAGYAAGCSIASSTCY
jgi:peptide/nickel transport system permease protein